MLSLRLLSNFAALSFFLALTNVQALLTPHIINNASTTACAILQSSLGTTIVQTSAGPKYDTTRSDTWNVYNARLEPACIVYPLERSHVQSAMRAIFLTGATYAVQAGSHSAMKGWNSVQDGVLISFSNMKTASYDAAKDTITLQPGIHWDAAVEQLSVHGVAPVGGRVGDVGTGLLLGGGLSFLSPSHGFAADSILAADVVLVSGVVVTATTTNQYADLLRAIKGGGNRFGIVMRYEVEAVHTGTRDDREWYGGTIIYAGDESIREVIKATANFVRDVNDPNAVLLAAVLISALPGLPGLPAFTPVLGLEVLYNFPGDASSATALPESIFGPFLSIPALAQILSPLSYVEVAALLTSDGAASGSLRGNGQHYGGSALVGDESLFLDAYTHWSNFSNAFITSESSAMMSSTLAFTPVSQRQIDYGRARGGNAINPPNGPYAAVQIAQQFQPGDDIPENAKASIQLLFDQIPPSAGKPLFLNECDLKQDVFATYGSGSGKEFLKRVYNKYDPTRFNVRHTEGPVGL